MNTFHLMLTAAIVLAGEIQNPGTLLQDVDKAQAENLLRRGRARLATPEELQEAGLAVPPEAHEVVATPVATAPAPTPAPSPAPTSAPAPAAPAPAPAAAKTTRSRKS